MPLWIKRISLWLAALVGLVLLIAWLALSAPFLAKFRGELVARLVNDRLGQNLRMDGGVRVGLGPKLRVTATDVVLPSRTMPDVDLIRIGQVGFDVALADLLQGRIEPRNLWISGARLDLEVAQDGTTSWAMPGSEPSRAKGTPPARPPQDGTGLVGFLVGQTLRIAETGVTYRDARNGLDLDLLLGDVVLGQADADAPVALEGSGTLNGQELTLRGDFPASGPFGVTADFSQLALKVTGTPEAGGYSTALSLDIAELGQLQEVLKLRKSVSGTGRVSAVIKTSDGPVRIGDLQVSVALDGGQSLELTGDLGELGNPRDVTIDTKIRLYRDEDRPPPTRSRMNLKLLGIDMQLLAQPDGIPTRRMVIETNGFVLDTSGVGPPPISFKQISRTPEGLLRIGKAEVRIGPPETPFLILRGVIGDALRLDRIDIASTLDLPLGSLVAPMLFQTSDILGRIRGGFRLRGNWQELALSDLMATSEGTDLWNLKVSGSVENAVRIRNVALDVSADVPSGAELLKVLKLEPIETGPVKLTSKLTSKGTEWDTVASIGVAESQLDMSLYIDFAEPTPTVRGKIESDLIEVAQVRDVISAALQLGRLNDLDATAQDSEAGGDGKKTEPLVLNSPVAEPDSPEPGPIRDVTLQPLGRAILLSGMDLDVEIDLRSIEGKNGKSSLQSGLEMRGRKASLGPLKFEYGDAFFNLSGSMDLDEDAGILKLSGDTGGWDFGKIMQELRFKKRASGVVNGKFEITGRPDSVREFIATMDGSASLSMRNGSIDTQLLDLAGLGVLPWLFSKERGPRAPIVCVNAPLQISQGRISTDRTVVETDKVQIVIFGEVDLKGKSLNIAGQPRRIGKPLARSPWPFTAQGPIADPKVKVKSGPRRLRRSDGSSTMPKRRKLCVPDILQLR